MTERAPVAFMYRTFGGRFTGPRQRAAHLRPVYEWDLTGIALATFLTRIGPYLQGKRQLAATAVTFVRRLRTGKPVGAEEAAYRQTLFTQMRRLIQQRGKARARLLRP